MTDSGTDIRPWTFDDFEIGAELGTLHIVVDDRRLSLWKRIYGEESLRDTTDTVPQGLLVAAMMEGYIKAIQPRPPGNIHAGQQITFASHQVAFGASLTLAFTCLGKEFKRERRWVTFGVRVMDGDRLAMSGEISSIWAA